MIFSEISHWKRYVGDSPLFKKAFEYLQTGDFTGLEPGKHLIDGENLFFFLQELHTKPQEECLWEAHRQYVDIHYILEGKEKLQFAPINRLKTGDYDEERDFLLAEGNGGNLTLEKGDFALFFPEDGHMTGITASAQPEFLRKVVIKVLNEKI